MVALLRRNLTAAPPPGATTVDFGHPLANGLLVCVVGGRELVRGATVELSGATVGIASPVGAGINTANSTSDFGRLPAIYNVESITTGLSIHATFYRGSGGTYQHVLNFPYAATWTSPYGLFIRIDDSGQWRYFQPTGAGSFEVVALGTPAAGDRCVTVTKNGTALKRYANGIEVGTGTLGASSPSWPATRRQPIIGQSFPGNTENWPGVIPLLAVWNRTLAADEAALLAREPFAFLTRPNAPRSRFIVKAPTVRQRRGWGIELAA